MKTVIVEYNGFSEKTDSAIFKASDVFRGSLDASGFWFDQNLRDLKFSFKTKIQADGFSKAIRDAFKRKIKVSRK